MATSFSQHAMNQREKISVALAASFSLEPLESGIRFWVDWLGWKSEIRLATYNQIFQNIYDANSVLRSNKNGCNFFLLRFEDFLRDVDVVAALRNDGVSANELSPVTRHFIDVVDELMRALDTYCQGCANPTYLLLAPSSDRYSKDKNWIEVFEQAECRLRQKVGLLPTLNWLDASVRQGHYSIATVFDAVRDKLGHIPFSEQYYAYLSTIVVRQCYAAAMADYKVVVVDCDNTLWEGVCAEVGAAGIVLRPSHLKFQQRLIDLYKQGVLICLCSKNNPEDVWQIFDSRSDMLLQRSHIVDARINWDRKSENIHSLSKSLNLNTDSFVFIDDNPMECAEVRAHAQNVLTLAIPQDEPAREIFVCHTWLFDRTGASSEDSRRTEMYRQSFARNDLKKNSNSFREFIESLELEVEFLPLSLEHVARVSQLIQKTNQFNLTSRKRSITEINHLLNGGDEHCFTVSVRDRFGDYGLVGVVIGKVMGKRFGVDTFLLSCRVMGRGAEYPMLNHLGSFAEQRQLETVCFSVKKTGKNFPALAFISGLEGENSPPLSEGTEWSRNCSVETLKAARFEPESLEQVDAPGTRQDGVDQAGLEEINDRTVAVSTSVAEYRRLQEKEQASLLENPFIYDMSEASVLIRRFWHDRQAVDHWNPSAQGCLPGKNAVADIDRHALSVVDNVKTCFADVIGIDITRIDTHRALEDYLNDSLQILDVTAALKRLYSDIPETILFECNTIANLSTVIEENYYDRDGGDSKKEKVGPDESRESLRHSKVDHTSSEFRHTDGFREDDIAIIGINAQCPAVDDIDGLWRLLKEGGSCISEIPSSRWRHDLYYDQDRSRPEKSYGRWGSFIQNIKKFDHSFFHISPGEAELMDPQQRLFLQVAWGLLEDASYTPERLERNTGVFVGITANDYAVYANAAALTGASAYRNADFFQVPNRVSYFFDLHGPSMAVDTACSSSGTALFLACESIKRGDCPLAIVGGVNLYIHPSRFVQYAQMQLLSVDRHCRPFGANASGTIFGEGVGALLLKPLTQAERDADHIYGVIKGYASNSGGKTNGFTIPNPQAHAELVKKALKQARIPARSLSYIEAHGTGTELGDPIEVRGLKLAFSADEGLVRGQNPTQYCAIGSIKSNIGHLEAAACIFSIIKVLLQMRHKMLAASINADQPNPHISFADTPFYLQRSLMPWPRPEVNENGERRVYPRRAGVSSFGAGGSNAHIIIEEYTDNVKTDSSHTDSADTTELIVLSARDQAALIRRCQQLIALLERPEHCRALSMRNLAYTLQSGRVAMTQRLAFSASNFNQVAARLRAYLAHPTAAPEVYLSAAETGSDPHSQASRLDHLARQWISGTDIGWPQTQGAVAPRRVPLPVYPFSGREHWLPEPVSTERVPERGDARSAWRQSAAMSALTLNVALKRDNFIIGDHIVAGRPILPGVAVLDLAADGLHRERPAPDATGRTEVLTFNGVSWLSPVVVSGPAAVVNVRLVRENHGYRFTLTGTPASEEVNAEGWIGYNRTTDGAPKPISISELSQKLPLALDREAHYQLFGRLNFQFGESFRAVQRLWLRNGEALAEIRLPEARRADFSAYRLHPSIMDAALQTAIPLVEKSDRGNIAGVFPFTLEQMIQYDALTPHCYAHAVESGAGGVEGISTFTIDIYAASGRKLLAIADYSVRKIKPVADKNSVVAELICYRPVWQRIDEQALCRERNRFFTVAGTAADIVIVIDRQRARSERIRSFLAARPANHSRIIILEPLPKNGDEDVDCNLFPELNEVNLREAKSVTVLHFCSDDKMVEPDLQAGDEEPLYQDAGTLLKLTKTLLATPEHCAVRIFSLSISTEPFVQPGCAALEALCRTLNKENARFHFHIIGMDIGNDDPARLLELLERCRNHHNAGVQRLCLSAGAWWQSVLQPLENLPPQNQVVATDVILITGGHGGVGRHIVGLLAAGGARHIVITGRRPADAALRQKLDTLSGAAVTVEYRRANVCSLEEMSALVAAVEREHGPLNGVIHCAGTLDDTLFVNKRMADFRRVAAPKTRGTRVLDHCTRKQPLNYFVVCSSLSAVLGNPGQCDYAFANAFADAFCERRNTWLEKGGRRGISISINWPYWRDAGMQLDSEALLAWREDTAMQPLPTAQALAVLQTAIAQRWQRVVVAYGARAALQTVMAAHGLGVSAPTSVQMDLPVEGARENPLPQEPLPLSKIIIYVKGLVANVLKEKPELIDTRQRFERLGVDSLIALKIIRTLEKDVGSLRKTLLFENFCVEDLAVYLKKEFTAKLADKLNIRKHSAAEGGRPAGEHEGRGASSQRKPLMLLAATAEGNEESCVTVDAELQGQVKALFQTFGRESHALARRDIAPHIFLGGARRGYFYCKERAGVVLALHYVGPEDYFIDLLQELNGYCQQHGHQLNVLTATKVERLGESVFTNSEFAVLQSIPNLGAFTTKGQAVRHLRYQVNKYARAGRCFTREYTSFDDTHCNIAIAELIDRWCESKAVVNPYIGRVKREILAGSLDHQHRIFLTYRDEVLDNVIIITAVPSDHGYLMDLEFYHNDMPLGGLEYTIVNIIEQLQTEGYQSFSLGITFGMALGGQDDGDEVAATLKDLRSRGTFDGRGNFQFKNKFRPHNRSLYLCRPAGASVDTVTDIILMIADPDVPAADAQMGRRKAAAKKVDAVAQQTFVPPDVGQPNRQARYEALRAVDFNIAALPSAAVDFDLLTDSWAQLETDYVTERLQYLCQQPGACRPEQQGNPEQLLSDITAMPYVTLVSAGRTAEALLCEAWLNPGGGAADKETGGAANKEIIVPQNLLFPTFIYHQLDNDFTPREIPQPEVFELQSEALFRGGIDLDQLSILLREENTKPAFVCLELSNNACGGYPVSLPHLAQLRAMTRAAHVPLVLDATRVLENAWFILRDHDSAADTSLWQVTRELCAHADCVTASLCKDFGVARGGFLATADSALFEAIQPLLHSTGSGLDKWHKEQLGRSLRERPWLQQQIRQRFEVTETLWRACRQLGLPVLSPAAGHCVVIDINRMPAFNRATHPAQSFLVWLYLATGIRAGMHNVGMQRDGALGRLVRLAVPLAMPAGCAEAIAERLQDAFSQPLEPVLVDLVETVPGFFNEVRSVYRLSSPAGAATQPLASASVNTDEQPAQPAPGANAAEAGDIAVIGLSGRYPGAADVNQFWCNLAAGVDSITEDKRAAWCRFKKNPADTLWGGFIEDVDCFDAQFFALTPREAANMDPQERLFLQTAWSCFENAGYFPASFCQTLGSRAVGVYVGVVWSLYQTLGFEQVEKGNLVTPHSMHWSIANRVSSYMDLRGPSLTIDTACSSSLAAIHLACESIRRGETAAALAGGVNLDLHPLKYLVTRAHRMLSPQGRCKAFAQGGDGYVAGEGVGAVLLKPLARATADGDHVYAVIKASALNHGGATSGYTMPNPNAQTALIGEVLSRAGIDARSVGYVEAHGTGTELGDPVEMLALTHAFNDSNAGEGAHRERQYCALGSVKSNIGHLEAAAGIAGLTKVLLQMRYRQLVPSLHAEQLNPHIDFDNSPFYLQQQLQDWQPRVAEGKVLPLRAGVSSFGAGGANAHILLEQPPTTAPAQLSAQARSEWPRIIPLSAKTPQSLKETAARLCEYLRAARHDTCGPVNSPLRVPAAELNPDNIAYTLQVGREAMPHRLALAVDSIDELLRCLDQYLADGNCGGYAGTAVDSNHSAQLPPGAEGEAYLRQLLESGQHGKLARLWAEGAFSQWPRLHTDRTPRRIPLPTYAFSRARHWIKQAVTAPPNALSPLLDRLVPTAEPGEHILFSKTFTRDDIFLQHHIVGGQPILAGVCHLALAAAALRQLSSKPREYTLQKVAWMRPLVVETSSEVRISIAAKQDRLIYKIANEDATVLYSRGEWVRVEPQAQTASRETLFDVESLRNRYDQRLEAPEFYTRLSAAGIDYGAYFKPVHRLYWNGEEALAELHLDRAYHTHLQAYPLQPGLLDGALQAATVLLQPANHTGAQAYLPFAVERVDILAPLTAHAYSHVQRAGSQYDVALLDEVGRECVRFSAVTFRPFRDEQAALFFLPRWRIVPEQKMLRPAPAPSRTLLVYPARCHALAGLIAAHYKPGTVTRVSIGAGAADPAAAQAHIDVHAARAFDAALDSLRPDNVIFIGAVLERESAGIGLEMLSEAREYGVLALFGLLQSLVRPDRGAAWPTLRVVTADSADLRAGLPTFPFSAAIGGLVAGFANEYPKCPVGCFDISSAELETDSNGRAWQAALAQALLGVVDPRAAQGAKQWALRGGIYYERYLSALPLARPTSSAFRQHGVYLIVGGAGGIGRELTRYLLRTYEARVVWIGRRPLQDHKHLLQPFHDCTGVVDYLQADATDPRALAAAVAQVKARHGAINGAIHSALILRDQSLAAMESHSLAEVLAPKMEGSWNLYQAVKYEPLDFLLFFSSAAAFLGTKGQSNYVAASCFEDALAHYLNRCGPFPVRLINWGYWESYGANLEARIREHIAARGFASITDAEGMQAIERVLTQSQTQWVVFKGSAELLQTLGVDSARPALCYEHGEAVPVPATELIASLRQPPVADAEKLIQAYTQLKHFGHQLLLHRLRSAGVLDHPGSADVADRRPSESDLAAQLRLLPDYRPLLQAWLEILAESGCIERQGGHIRVLVAPQSEAERARREQDLLQEKNALERAFPVIQAHLQLLWQCLLAAPAVIDGRRNPAEVLFPAGSKNLVEKIYQGNPVMDYYNHLVAELVRAYVERRLAADAQARIAILEAGAGIGGTSAFVLRALRPYHKNIHYLYTDLSASFINHGRRRFAAQYPFVEFKIFNVERCPVAQGLAPGTVDLAFASNVLHATTAVENSLRQLKKTLKQGALLVVNETTSRQDFATLTFGLTRGWWLFKDPACRIANTPLLRIDQWRQQLALGGFDDFSHTLCPPHLGAVLDQTVMAALSDGIVDAAEADAVAPEAHPPRPNNAEAPALPQTPATGAGANTLHGRVKNYLKTVFAEVLMMCESELNTAANFFELGVDSIIVMDINERLERDLGDLPMTLLFDYSSIDELADHLHAVYRGELATFMGIAPDHSLEHRALENSGAGSGGQTVASGEQEGGSAAETAATDLLWPQQAHTAMAERSGSEPPRAEDIAIIGINGHYPGARDLDRFWENLRQGKDCITEVPPGRWDWHEFSATDAQAAGTSYSKWGGFIEDVDCFDSLFFGIAPKEAEITDPNERLFLQCAWGALESAGYAPGAVRSIGGDVGVFAGVMNGAYDRVAAVAAERHGWNAAQSAYWSIANRVSHCFDFYGPSMAVDTACSSSLTAIHLACMSIRAGECRAALAGGVNLILHPSQFQNLAAKQMLARDGKTKSFAASADGFVNGEGVGVAVLKCWQRARADGDYIFAVIKGSAINAGGRSSGYHVPNPKRQQQVIATALRNAGVEARTVTYVEAHGTGTELGDPIEVTALDQAYGGADKRDEACAIGSVKTNIGHLEAAAAIAGLTKIVLQLHYRTLVPSLHAQALNHKIRFEQTRFSVQRELGEWACLYNDQGRPLPRRAGLSSFGAGGANAHLIVEEYPGGQQPPVPALEVGGEQLIVISARTKPQLLAFAATLLDHLTARLAAADHAAASGASAPFALHLRDIAFSLQVGRAPMSARLALVTADVRDLCDRLRNFVRQQPAEGGLLYNLLGTIALGGQGRNHTASSAQVQRCVAQNNLHQVAELWLAGEHIPWRELHSDHSPRLVPLPVTVFAGKRYWLDSYPEPQQALTSAPATVNDAAPVAAHARTAIATAGPAPTPRLTDAELMLADCVRMRRIDTHIALIEMREVAQKNMFSAHLISGLKQAFQLAQGDNSIKVIVISGYDNIFSMGGTQQDLVAIAEQRKRFTDEPFFFRGLLQCEIPVIAAMQGHAAGGGLLFGLYADFTIMAEESVYAASFMRYGFTPGMGATYILPEKLGRQIATEMLFTAKSFSGAELVKRYASVPVKPRGEVLEEAFCIARSLADKPLASLRLLKRELSERDLRALDDIVAREQHMHEQSFALPEVRSRIDAHFARLKGNSGAEIKAAQSAQGTPPRQGVHAAAAAVPKQKVTLPGKEKPAANVDGMQLRDSGKVRLEQLHNRRAAPAAARAVAGRAPLPQHPAQIPAGAAAAALYAAVEACLHIPAAELDLQASLSDLGMDSIASVEIVRTLNGALGLHLEATVLYDHATPAALIGYLQKRLGGGHTLLATPNPAPTSAAGGHRIAGARREVGGVLRAIIGAVLHLDSEDCSADTSLSDLGVDSIAAVEITREINRHFGLRIEVSELYDYPDIDALAQFLAGAVARGADHAAASQAPAGEAGSLRDYVYRLSDDEVAKLLDEALAEEASFSVAANKMMR